MTGLEPATPCSQSKRPTNWATSVCNGDSDGTRTCNLHRDRLAFYTTELRSHILVGRAGLEPAVSIKSRIYSPVRYQLRSTYPYGDGGGGSNSRYEIEGLVSLPLDYVAVLRKLL